MSRKKRKRQNVGRTVLVALTILAVVGMLIYYFTRELNEPAFVRYREFGIDIPRNFTIHGIDVSRHQGTINWKEVSSMNVRKVKIGFAFIKATEGISRVDPQFRRNWFRAGEAGIKKGAYHFFIASKSGKAQAENFLATANLKKGDLYPVLDVEQTHGVSKEQLQQRVADWLKIVEEELQVKPIIYTNADFYSTFLSGRFDEYPLWVAHYLVKDKPRIARPWMFWQHSETGRVNGIRTGVDFNVFNGDSVQFSKLLMP